MLGNIDQDVSGVDLPEPVPFMGGAVRLTVHVERQSGLIDLRMRSLPDHPIRLRGQRYGFEASADARSFILGTPEIRRGELRIVTGPPVGLDPNAEDVQDPDLTQARLAGTVEIAVGEALRMASFVPVLAVMSSRVAQACHDAVLRWTIGELHALREVVTAAEGSSRDRLAFVDSRVDFVVETHGRLANLWRSDPVGLSFATRDDIVRGRFRPLQRIRAEEASRTGDRMSWIQAVEVVEIVDERPRRVSSDVAGFDASFRSGTEEVRSLPTT